MSVRHDDLTFDRLGHASVRISSRDGPVVYIDPWSDVIEGTPRDGDLVVVTHDDRDHYDPEAIAAVVREDGTIAAYEAIDTTDLEQDVVGLPHEGRTTVAGVEIRSVPAHNDPDGDHLDGQGEPFHAPGEVIGVVFTLDGTTIFYPSDTDFLPHHESIDADVFLPPIGGHFTMDRHEAARFTRSVHPSLVLPLHYDTFEAIETDAKAFASELEADGIEAELF